VEVHAPQHPLRLHHPGPAHLHDPAGSTGYVHDGARWYNPQIGAFQTQDTNSYLANLANGNRYAHAADNPLNNTDPTGQSLLGDVVGLGIGIVAVALASTVVGPALAFATIAIGADVVACDTGAGLACGVF
jgi:RHS repeat-associated protein